MDLSGINNFRKRLQGYADKMSSFAMAIAEKGVEIAKGYYSGDVNVYAENDGVGSARIIAEGENVFFDEYGTGWVGEGTYPGELPSNTFTFESAGKMRSTQGWVYHYPNTDTKKPKDNPSFWYYNGEQHTGQIAQAQMWKTSRDLREKFPQYVSEIVNAERNSTL